jgi:O-succinylbenzoate synthase
VDTPIAADESVRLPGDADAVVAADAADIIVLKVAPLGGVRACLEIAERAGLPVVVSSALESSVGLAAGIALARALPELPYACGLGTGLLLATDTVTKTLVPRDGVLRARELEVIV